MLIMALTLTGCSGVAGTGVTVLPESTGQSPAASAAAAAFTASYAYSDDDMNAEWDKEQAASVMFGGDSAEVTGSGAAFADGTLTIGQAGTYALTGTLSDGQVLIDAGKDDTVRLVLNGVFLNNSSGPAIYAPQSEKVVLILEDGTENTVTDGASYTAANDGNEPDAAIFVQDDLSVTGGGTLTVTGNHAHGIRAQDILTVTGGTLNITAAGDALRGRDGVAIKDGSFVLNAGGDGIQSNNADDDTQGFVVIDGGVYSIKPANDGIQAESSLTVTGGTLQITTGGGSANAPVQADNFRGGFGGGQWNAADTTEETVSMKALKSGKQLTIAGGDITIDAEDDAVHSNGNITVTAGSLFIQTGDDAIHTDTDLTISGGAITVTRSYEALEGSNIYITGGDMDLLADDDAINAAGGSSNGTDAGRFDVFSGGGDYTIDISGGAIQFFSGGDGVDSNGNLNISGGTLIAVINSSADNSALDSDGVTTVTGGLVIAGGTGTFGNLGSSQGYVYLTDVAAGDEITVSSGGEILASYTADRSLSSLTIFAPGIVSGQSYDVSAGGQVTQVTAGTGGGGMGFGGMGGGRGGRNEHLPDGMTPPGGGFGGDRQPPDGFTPPAGGI
jgi:hypothetical protein